MPLFPPILKSYAHVLTNHTAPSTTKAYTYVYKQREMTKH